MSNYPQWWAGYGCPAKARVSRVTWVCGPETLLVEEVADRIRGVLSPSLADYRSFTAGSDPDSAIWDAASEYPGVPGAVKLVSVRDAARMTSLAANLPRWFSSSRQLPGVHLMFLSGEDDYPFLPATRTLRDYGRVIGDKGHFVRCGSLSPEDGVEWIKRRAAPVPVAGDVASYILERCGGDLSAAASVAGKARVLGGKFTTEAVDALCQENSGTEFADRILWCDIPGAFRAIPALSPRDSMSVIGLLDSRLDLIEIIAAEAKSRKTAKDIATSRNLSYFLVKRYLPAARHYSRDSFSTRRQALALADSALRSGAREGVLEMLAAHW